MLRLFLCLEYERQFNDLKRSHMPVCITIQELLLDTLLILIY